MSQETVKFLLNDKEVEAKAGMTVMEVAKEQGVDIPHFCWHPGLRIAGVCRFCMVKVDDRPKLEIACNLPIRDGMKVDTVSEDVKESHKWALEFHLVNHPLDCPICDQAGECKLQDFYMDVGKYKSQMTRPKVLKPKALEVGDDLVLDTERCILCERCTRFEEDVTKTGALGIFNRGDRSVIGTYPGKRIKHDYETNLVDICPVGAFTSKDFRFKQRVWFLKDKPAVCPGCSTGCHVNVYGKVETGTYYRVKPRESAVNGHWMCDKGRQYYQQMNPAHRLRKAILTDDSGRRRGGIDEAMASLATRVAEAGPSKVALLVSAQYTNEEYQALFDYFVGILGVKNIFQWREPGEDIDAFDGILLRGDRNANTKGLLAAMQAAGLSADKPKDEFDDLAKSGAEVVIALAPEVDDGFPSLESHLRRLEELPFVSVWSINRRVFDHEGLPHALPMKGFAEKTGTFTNHAGEAGELNTPFPVGAEDARDVIEVVASVQQVMAHLAN